MIKITIKGLAKFITATEQGKRKVLRDFKYPDLEGIPQALYYREARDFIAAYHRSGSQPDWLLERARRLSELAQTTTGASVSRLRNNARALREYSAFWGGKKFEVLGELRLDLRFGEIRVSVVPDLHVQEAGVEKLVKLDFATKAPDARVPKIISQALFEAAVCANLKIAAGNVLYVDVARSSVTKGARLGSRMAGEIKAACQNIEAIWDRI